jgi:mono/diheme cytochrome c family protein
MKNRLSAAALAAAALAAAPLALAAAGPSPAPTKASAPAKAPGAADPKKIAKGQDVYKNTCMTCHGEKFDGKGEAGQYMKPLPRNLVSDAFKNGDKEEEILKTVSNGLDGTAMVAFLQPKGMLNEDEASSVAAYVASLRKKK